MGHRPSQELTVALVLGACATIAIVTAPAAAFAAPAPGVPPRVAPQTLVEVQREINSLEHDLLESKEKQTSAGTQLRKIRRLMSLQRKEIELSQKKIDDLGQSLGSLSAQKRVIIENIDRQKAGLRRKLRELDRIASQDMLDASWLRNPDAFAQREYYLSRTLRKDLGAVEKLKSDVQAALLLELKIIEERERLDYYVQELKDQSALLSANEEVQKEILRTNRSNRLDALRRVRSLRESERELEHFLVTAQPAPALEGNLAELKGKLPLPTSGAVLSSFGRAYDAKTNLFTFQKGITIGASSGAEVRAVSGGKVVFVGPLKNYGNIVILEHPGQYYSLYGQLGRVLPSEGQAVRPGEVVGSLLEKPLYFEIRKKNVAINPLHWFPNGSIKLSQFSQ